MKLFEFFRDAFLRRIFPKTIKLQDRDIMTLDETLLMSLVIIFVGFLGVFGGVFRNCWNDIFRRQSYILEQPRTSRNYSSDCVDNPPITGDKHFNESSTAREGKKAMDSKSSFDNECEKPEPNLKKNSLVQSNGNVILVNNIAGTSKCEPSAEWGEKKEEEGRAESVAREEERAKLRAREEERAKLRAREEERAKLRAREEERAKLRAREEESRRLRAREEESRKLRAREEESRKLRAREEERRALGAIKRENGKVEIEESTICLTQSSPVPLNSTCCGKERMMELLENSVVNEEACAGPTCCEMLSNESVDSTGIKSHIVQYVEEDLFNETPISPGNRGILDKPGKQVDSVEILTEIGASQISPRENQIELTKQPSYWYLSDNRMSDRMQGRNGSVIDETQLSSLNVKTSFFEPFTHQGEEPLNGAPRVFQQMSFSVHPTTFQPENSTELFNVEEEQLLKISINEAVNYFNQPKNKKNLKKFYHKIIEVVDKLSYSRAADLIRLPVKTNTPDLNFSKVLCNKLLESPEKERNLSSSQLALVAWSLAKTQEFYYSETSSNKQQKGYNCRDILNSIALESLPKIREFHPLSVANMMWGFGKLKCKHEALLMGLGESAYHQLEDFNAQNIANTYWCLGTLELSIPILTPVQSTSKVCQVLKSKLLSFNSQALSNFVWSCARIRWCNRLLMMDIANFSATQVETFKPQEIANFMWGLAKLGLKDTSETVRIFANRASNILGNLNSQEVCNVYWALARLGIKSSECTPVELTDSYYKPGYWGNPGTTDMPSFEDSSSPSFHDRNTPTCYESVLQNDFLEQSSYNSWSRCGKNAYSRNKNLEFYGIEGFKNENPSLEGKGYRLKTEVTEPYSVDNFNPIMPGSVSDQPSNPCNYFQKGSRDSKYRKLLQNLLLIMKDFNSQAIANFIWACGKLQWRCNAVLELGRNVVMKNIKFFRSQNTANLLWALAKLKYRDEEIIHLLVFRAVESLETFNSQELANIYWALAVLGITNTPLTYDESSIGESIYDNGSLVQQPGEIDCAISSGNNEIEMPNFLSYSHSPRNHLISWISSVIKKKLAIFNSQEIANFFWVCGRLRWRRPEILKEALINVARLMSTLKQQEINNILEGMAQLGYRDETALKMIAEHVVLNINNFSPQIIANIYYSFAQLNFKDSMLTALYPDKHFLVNLIRTIKKLRPAEFELFVDSCRFLQWRNEQVIDVMVREIAKRCQPSNQMLPQKVKEVCLY